MPSRPVSPWLLILLVVMFIILGIAEMRASEVSPEYKAVYHQ